VHQGFEGAVASILKLMQRQDLSKLRSVNKDIYFYIYTGLCTCTHVWLLRNFRLPPPCKWDSSSSGMLHNVY